MDAVSGRKKKRCKSGAVNWMARFKLIPMWLITVFSSTPPLERFANANTCSRLCSCGPDWTRETPRAVENSQSIAVDHPIVHVHTIRAIRDTTFFFLLVPNIPYPGEHMTQSNPKLTNSTSALAMTGKGKLEWSVCVFFFFLGHPANVTVTAYVWTPMRTLTFRQVRCGELDRGPGWFLAQVSFACSMRSSTSVKRRLLLIDAYMSHEHSQLL